MTRMIVKGSLAVLAIAIGSAVTLWILENEFFYRFPGYHRPRLPTAYALPVIMIFVGFKWGAQALEQFRRLRADHRLAADAHSRARR